MCPDSIAAQRGEFKNYQLDELGFEFVFVDGAMLLLLVLPVLPGVIALGVMALCVAVLGVISFGVMALGFMASPEVDGCMVLLDIPLVVGAGLILLSVAGAFCASAAPAVPRNRQQARISLRDMDDFSLIVAPERPAHQISVLASLFANAILAWI
jgi:hypothetical protein